MLDIQKEPIVPSKKEAALAKESSKVLASYIKSTKTPTIQLGEKGRIKGQITLPASALNLLLDILVEMSEGNAVSLLSIHTELTTQEAADLLNISRPYLVRLLEEHKIPYRKVGSKRRILVKDIVKYKASIDQSRLKVLEELTEQAQKLNMGY